MEDIIIRKINYLDLGDFAGLCDEKDWFYPQVSQLPQILMNYKEYRENCYVAYTEDILVGFVYGGVLCDTLYPQFMYVKETHRNQGISRKLLNMLEKESNCTVSLLYYNKSLRTHYKNQGYEVGTELEVAMKQLSGGTE